MINQYDCDGKDVAHTNTGTAVYSASSYRLPQTRYQPSNAFDGDTGTSWLYDHFNNPAKSTSYLDNGNSIDGHHLQVDVIDPVVITSFTFLPSSAAITAKFLLSNDELIWTEFFSIDFLDLKSTADSDQHNPINPYHFKFENNIAARYYRCVVTSAGSGDSLFSIQEWQLKSEAFIVDGIYSNLPTTTNGTGEGATVEITIENNTITNIMVDSSATSPYSVGDILTVSKDHIPGAIEDIIITLTIDNILTNKYTVPVLKQVGYTGREITDGGYDFTELKNAGFTVSELLVEEFIPNEIRLCGYTGRELIDGGYPYPALSIGGYNAISLFSNELFSLTEIKDAEFLPSDFYQVGGSIETSVGEISLTSLGGKSYSASGYNTNWNYGPWEAFRGNLDFDNQHWWADGGD